MKNNDTLPLSVADFVPEPPPPLTEQSVGSGSRPHHAANDPKAIELQIKTLVHLASEPTEEQVNRLARMKTARNPLYEAAKPLLLSLAKMPRTSFKNPAVEVEAFRQLLQREVMIFQSLCAKANLDRAHATTASYCLCTALDEAANSTHWGGSQQQGELGVWSKAMLASTVHGDIDGGRKFFLLAGRLSTQPDAHLDLLEVMYYILSLGFEGQYSTGADGKRHLETIRQRLYTLFMAGRDPVPLALSPRWQGVAGGAFKRLTDIPVWLTVAVLGSILLGMFAWYKYQLANLTDQVVADIVAIGEMRPPPVAPAPPLQLAQLLKDDIARGRVTVAEDAGRSGVTFRGDDMFIPGQATVNPKIRPLLDKVAAEIAKVAGGVQVIGHSDSQAIRTGQFPNNQVLSEARAASVAAVLCAAGVAADRIEIIGRGASQPLTGNATAADRAKNRRVEIVVAQGHDGAGATAMRVTTSVLHSSSAAAATPPTSVC